ncbi:MAG: hypothetical protein HY360_12675 [Verrucomicrobia bacterium]|nr:hypothetical protein [Verrucomicrobiota bacterium]
MPDINACATWNVVNMGSSFVLKIALLLFGSGMCALGYQTVWLREFRLIFGCSTAASAAVLAVFMGGIGLGSLWLGPRSDRKDRPLAFYAQLEVLIALFAAATPFLIFPIQQRYVAMGGTPVLGLGLGSAACLFLSTLVLGIPTFLMGGTLPAAVRAVETDDDVGRCRAALLYGANALGAVTGAMLSTFFFSKNLGTVRHCGWRAD